MISDVSTFLASSLDMISALCLHKIHWIEYARTYGQVSSIRGLLKIERVNKMRLRCIDTLIFLGIELGGIHFSSFFGSIRRKVID